MLFVYSAFTTKLTVLAILLHNKIRALFFQPKYYITKNEKKANCQKHNNTKLFIFTCKAGGGFRIAAAVCFCLPAGVSHPALVPADF